MALRWLETFKRSDNLSTEIVRPSSKSGGTSSKNDQESESIQMNSLLSHPDGPLNSSEGASAYFVGTNGQLLRIDFVLVHTPSEKYEDSIARNTFKANLVKDGMILGSYVAQSGVTFTKIHCPWSVLSRYGEILKLKMPLKKSLFTEPSSNATLNKLFTSALNTPYKKWRKSIAKSNSSISDMLESININYDDCNFSVAFTRARKNLFDIPDKKEDFFSPAQISTIIQFILKRTSFTNNSERDELGLGITRLLADGVYSAAFPLHEDSRHSLIKYVPSFVRDLGTKPFDESPKKRNAIRYYFGERIGLYFAFLRFYAYMLVPVLFVGICCTIYGSAMLIDHKPSNDICNSDTLMCPRCDEDCRYWFLKESCISSRITYVIDNGGTVFYSIFIVVWCGVFLELWNKYSAKLTHRWDITDVDQVDEHSRPEYLMRLREKEEKVFNFSTKMFDPYIPYWKRRCCSIATLSVTFLLVTVAIVPIVGVMLYSMCLSTVLNQSGRTHTTFERILTSVTASILNLIGIRIFNLIYNRMAKYLTDIEYHRTQTEYDDQLALKLFLLQFVNNYASIFYIAFFKGRFIGHPGDYKLFLGFRQEECGPSGCRMELTIQIFIIIVGSQFFNMVMEALSIGIKKCYWFLQRCKQQPNIQWEEKNRDRCEEEHQLPRWGTESLYFEYLNMMLQFGFVTIFAAAFPLASFFALVSNMLQINFTARKLLCFYKRPVGVRARNIGIWYRILKYIVKIAAVTNGIIIAFTSDLIPQIVYRFAVSEDGSMQNYLNYSLSFFNTSDFPDHIEPVPLSIHTIENATDPSLCRYKDLRYPPWSEKKYLLSDDYWYLLSIRFAFVLIYEAIIMIITHFVIMCIPDQRKLRKMICIENCIVNEIITEQESIQRSKRCEI